MSALTPNYEARRAEIARRPGVVLRSAMVAVFVVVLGFGVAQQAESAARHSTSLSNQKAILDNEHKILKVCGNG